MIYASRRSLADAVKNGLRMPLLLLGFIFLFSVIGLVSAPGAYATGEVWSGIDADATIGLNHSGSYDGQYPAVATIGNYIYVAWQESNGTAEQIRVSQYDKTAGTWSSIDGGGANGINYDTSRGAGFPYLTVYSNELYIVWQEDNATGTKLIHVRKYSGSGSTWNDIDDRENPNISPTTKSTPCLNFDTNANANAPLLSVYNGKLYAAWSEVYNTVQQIRVIRYDGGQVWNFVEKATPDTLGVNYNTNNNAGWPGISADNNYLYLAWLETNGANKEVRVKKYDGTTWTSGEGGTSPLVSYSTVEQSHGPQLVVHNGTPYISWHQSSYTGTYGEAPQTKLMKYSGVSWTFVNGNTATNGLNHDINLFAYRPAVTQNNNNLFLFWDEYDASGVNQIRAISYNNDSRAFIDGAGSTGINKAAGRVAVEPILVTDSQFLYAVWYEYNGSKNVVRIKRLALPAAPAAIPAAGSVAPGTTVALSTATVGASIYYTTDGSNPTSASTPYAGPITISAATTIKAIAISGGTINSDTLTSAYTIKAAAPTANVAAGEVAAGTNVTLSTATAGASIYYTTDGVTTPTAGSTLYAGAITINANTTIKAIAIKAGMTDSDILTAAYTVKAAAPTASVAAGEVAAGTNVTLSTATAGASIYYTTDGVTTPTAGSTLYAGAITINANTTVKAIAIKAGMTNSDILSVAYTVKAANPTASVPAGAVAAGTTVTLSTTTAGASIYYTTDGVTTPTAGSTLYAGAITINANTTIKAIAIKAGMTDSDILTAAYTVKAAAPTAAPGAGAVASGTTVSLSATTAGANIYYTTDGVTTPTAGSTLYAGPITINAATTIKAIAIKAGMTDSDILTAAYTVKAVAPTAAPGAGAVAAGSTVTLSTATAGASIYYTTDGVTTPNAGSTLYAGPITINANTTVKAIAIKAGMSDSDILSVAYTVKAAAPTAAPGAGAVAAGSTVSLSTATAGANIYYTTDGITTPTAGSTLYAGPITINANTTVKAIALKAGMTDSDILTAAYTIMDKVATPTAAPGAGAVAAGTTVTLSTATAGASIYYTTDGVTNPTAGSTLYAGAITINAATTIKAIAIKAGMTDSNILSVAYTVKAAAPTANVPAGEVAAGTTVTLSTATAGANIYYTTDGITTPTAGSTLYASAITINAATTIKAIAIKAGMTDSDILTAAYTIMDKVATPAAAPGAGAVASGTTVALSTATAGASIYYTTDGITNPTAGSTLYAGPITINAATTIKAIAIKAGMTDSDILTAAYTIMDKAATPSAAPGAGAVAAGTTVTLSTATAGASIYYTTDGVTTPTAGSTLYAGAITINAATTIKAIAIKAGMTDSDILTANYTILPPDKVATPTAAPVAGAVAAGTTVTLSTATAGASIFYTTDGTDPTSGSTPYTVSIAVNAPTTIKAIAFKVAMTDSDILTADYTILPPDKVATPAAAPGAGAVASGTTVALSSATAGADIYYTTDGVTTPTAGSTLYAGPITINAATTIKAIAIKGGMSDSDAATFSYTIIASGSESGGSGTPAPQAVNSTSGSADIDPDAGGTVGLGVEATVKIPAAALKGQSDVKIEVSRIDTPPAVPAGFTVLGNTYEFMVGDSNSYQFDKPVTLTFTFDPSKVPAGQIPTIQYYDQQQGKWVDLGGAISGNTISLNVNHFTKFAVMVKVANQDDKKEEPPTPLPVKPLAITDISGHWAENNIKALVNTGAISCYSDGSFRPDRSITRAEFTVILVKAFRLEAKEGKVFTDTASHWAKDSISVAVASGIVGGYGNGCFDPDDPITREQMAVMLSKAAELRSGSDASGFKDDKVIAEWAKPAVELVVANGIMSGYPDKSFRPQGKASRAEAVTVVLKVLGHK